MQRSDRQLVTALVTTGLQNCTASAGTHSSTEAVRLGALTLIWLVCTLHKNLFLNLSSQSSRYPLGVAADHGLTILPEIWSPFEKFLPNGVWLLSL